MNEPKDGDFVAYIDALERESAARLKHGALPPHAQRSSDDLSEEPKRTDRAGELHTLLDQFLRRDGDAMLVRPFVAAVVGLVALLVWLGHGGLFWLLVALMTLLYGIPRLARALRLLNQPTSSRAAIEQKFGKSDPR